MHQCKEPRGGTTRRQTYWWDEEIAQARARCIQDRRKWSRAKTRRRKEERKQNGNVQNEDNLQHLEKSYKTSKKKVVKLIYKAKEKTWRELIKDIDKDQWETPYRVIMNKL